MKRRNFISAAGIAAGSLILGRTGLSFPYMGDFKFTDIDEDELWKEIREHFLYSENLCYLNTAGNGALPDSVLNELSKAMKHDAMHPGPGTKGEKWEAVKKKCAKLLSNDIDNSEIALTGSTTEGCNIIINGLPLKKGDEVITSTHAHPAVIVPLLNRMKAEGIVIKTFEPDLLKAAGNIEKIKALINRRTKLIFVSHITFTTGQIFPIKEIGQLARHNNIWFAVDGAQAVGNIPIEIKDSNVDFYTFGGCKWLVGPKRTGVLYVRKEMLETCTPITVGGGSYDTYDISKGELMLLNSAQRYEYGTRNNALFYGLSDAIGFIHEIGLERIHHHNKKLAERFVDGLEKINGIEMLSPAEKDYRSSIIAFSIQGKDCMEVYFHLIRKKKIRVRPVFEDGLNFVRASFHMYNNEEDVDKLLYEIKNY